MRDLDLRQLRAMTVIDEEGTFGRAAERLGYTQSSISQQLAALERTVGGRVFDRPGGPRPVRLTPLGEVVLQRARTLLRHAEELADAVDRFQAGEGRIDIGTLQSVSSVILPRLLRRLREEHPGCEVRLSEGEADNPSIGDLDLLFYDGPTDDDVDSTILMEDPYLVVACPGDFPQDEVGLESLNGLAMVAWPATCDQPRMEKQLAGHGARPEIVFRSSSNEVLLSMVRAGLGCAVLPWLALTETWTDQRLHVHRVTPALSRTIQLHRPANRTQSPLAVKATQIARDIAAQLSTDALAVSGISGRGTAT